MPVTSAPALSVSSALDSALSGSNLFGDFDFDAKDFAIDDFLASPLALSSLTTSIPFLLLPVKVQIKFMQNSDSALAGYAKESPNTKRYKRELLVRIYPDQLSIDHHEEQLTDSEVEAGRQYWLQALTSPDREQDTPHSLLAWQVLLGHYGASRAYWIVLQTALDKVEQDAFIQRSNLHRLEAGSTPESGSSSSEGGNWLTAFNHDLTAALANVQISTSKTAWNRAALATCLPDRFVVALYNKIPDVTGVKEPYIRELIMDNHPIAFVPGDVTVTPNNPTIGTTHPNGSLLDQSAYVSSVIDLTAEFLELVRLAAGSEIKGNELPVGLNPQAGSAITPPTGEAGQMEDAPSEAPSEGQAEGHLPDELDEHKGFAGALAWLADFNKAVEVGMGVVIELKTNDEFTRGFDRLLVVGARANNSPEAEAAKLTALLNAHTYTDSLELIPQGTPTNNTGDESAGYNSVAQYDAAATFKTFLQAPLFERQDSRELQQDGQRLAEALGVLPAVFEHAANAGRTDGQEATRFNRVLWPATLGYYMREMLEPVLSSKKVTAATRRFFEAYVTGRGPVSAFRIDTLPYGVLPTTWYSHWVPSPKLGSFGPLSWDIIRRLDVTWTERLNGFAQYPPIHFETPFISLPPSRQDILTVLGQEAASVEFYQRYFIGPSLMDSLAHEVPATQKVWPPLPQFDMGGMRSIIGYQPNQRENIPARYQAQPENPLFSNFLTFFDPKYKYKEDLRKWPYAFDVNYQVGYRKVVHTYADEPKPQPEVVGPIVDSAVISEVNPILPLLPPTVRRPGDEIPEVRNYIHWLAQRTFDEIRLRDFRPEFSDGQNAPDGFKEPNSLLYHLLRQAVMWRYWEAAEAVLKQQHIGRQEVELFNVLTNDTARWQWLYFPVDGLGNPLQNGTPLHAWLRNPDNTHSEAVSLRGYLDTLLSLATLPTARLERLLAEHLDLGNHRLDAWKTGHVLTRLLEQRQDAPQGIHLGAFGWLEGVYPQDNSTAGDNGLRIDRDNLGYIHAPTINHGLTAAVLRQGYKSRQFETDPNDPAANRMAINLSSERVRRALALMEGVRTGSSLAALLGRDFEAGLFNATPLGGTPSYALQIPYLRQQFPYADEKADPTQPAPRSAAPEQDALQVVNGLALLKANLPEDFSDYSYHQAFNVTQPYQAGFWLAVRREVNELQNTLDALGDLTVGESIYQSVIGNLDQAAAMLENVAKGKFPPSPEIVHPTRGGVSLTHRVLLHLPQTSAVQAWGTNSALALAEPALNNWLAQFFQDFTTLEFAFTYAVAGATPASAPGTAQLRKLGMHPLDLLFLLDQNALQAGSAFDLRLTQAVRMSTELAPVTPGPSAAAVVTVDYESSTLEPLKKLQLLLARIRQLLATSRPASATDLAGPSQLAPGQAQDNNAGIDSPGIDSTLWAQTRLATVRTALENAKASLLTAVATYQASSIPANLTALGTVLHEIGAYNLPDAYLATVGANPASSALAVAQTIQRRLEEATAAGQEPNAAVRYAEVAKALLGNDFRLSIPFKLPPADTYPQTFQEQRNNNSLLRAHTDNPDLLEEWLQGLAPVRDVMDHLEKVFLFNDLLWQGSPAHTLAPLVPTQLSMQPSPAGGAYWLGAEYPGPDEYTPPSDAVSLVQMLPPDYLPTDIQQALWLDEWVEIIPHQEEDTSLVFHYDQPNMEAPQTLLLAVAPNPEAQVAWDWQTLLGTVNESLDFAKKRAVEPANLALTHLGAILPLTVAPVSQEGATIAVDFRQLIERAQFLDAPHLPGTFTI